MISFEVGVPVALPEADRSTSSMSQRVSEPPAVQAKSTDVNVIFDVVTPDTLEHDGASTKETSSMAISSL